MFEVQKVALQKQEWNENSLIKKIQIISTFSKFYKDSTSLNLLVNITKGAVFSGTIKC